MNSGSWCILPLIVLVLLLPVAGCIQPEQKTAQESIPVIAIVYGSEKGDLSYTDAAYRGVLAAQKDYPFVIREFTPRQLEELPALLNTTNNSEKPGLVITVGFQYADLNRQLAMLHPEVRFLAIDQAWIGSETIQAYEITSYGDSYLAGALAANASKTGRVGIIMGMKTGLLETFIHGYSDGARSVNSSVVVDQAYVHRDSVEGFTDPEEAGRIAEGMYRNGTDVIFVGAGYSIMGVIDTANRTPGRYVIATDSDSSALAPGIILASAVKRVDR
ncbi:MAG: BMP family ABC transporter substrate-binding protein, partial [Methanomicrobiales archaeon]|nr:BMP family ABC transporter substrate-binding protein [Methanomicrobiales archaeon]